MRIAFRTVAAAAVVWIAGLAVPAHALDVAPVPNALGIDTWLVEEHDSPAVAMAMDFAGGSSQDPADRRGLTNLLVGLMYEGAGDLPSDAYKARLKDQSIQLGWEFDRDSLWGILITPGKNRDDAARLTGLALSAPRYDSADVERVRNLIKMGAGNRSPTSAALLAFMATMYPGHIYGVWESGDMDTLSAMTAADLLAYRQRILARDNLKVVFTGDIDAAGAAAMLAQAFAGLPAKAQLVAISDPSPPTARRIDTTGPVTQTSIRFGGPSVKRSDPDYAAANAVAYLVGSRGAGFRLFDALVTRAGLTNAVSFSLSDTTQAAWFAGNMNTRPEQAEAAIATLQDELKRFSDDGPTADELARAQTALVNDFFGHFDTIPAVAVELVNESTAGLGPEYPEHYLDQIASLTAANLKRVAQKMFAGGLVIYTLAPATP